MLDWEDSARPSPAWRHLSDIDDQCPILCRSVGWLLVDNTKVKVLAPNMGAINEPDNLQAAGVIVIPARAVLRIVRLREPNQA